MRVLRVTGSIYNAPNGANFKALEEVLIECKYTNSIPVHQYHVILGISGEKWAVMPHPKIIYSSYEYEEFFQINKADNNIVMLDKVSNLTLNNKDLGTPKHI